MAKLIQVEAGGYSRPAYSEVSEHEIDFRPKIRVLPALHYNEDRIFIFVKKHEPNTPGWKNGGYECREVNREDAWLPKFRAFELDALIIHPNAYNTTLD